MKSAKPDEFFKLVSVNSDVSDLVLIKNIFYGIVKTMSRELKARHSVKLPDWGEFKLRIHKSRRFKSITGEMAILDPKPTIKFAPDYKVKKYFQELGGL